MATTGGSSRCATGGWNRCGQRFSRERFREELAWECAARSERSCALIEAGRPGLKAPVRRDPA